MVFEMSFSQRVADNSRGLGMGSREVSVCACVRERESARETEYWSFDEGVLEPYCLFLKTALQPDYWCLDLQSAP